jgi:serine/threonine protein kinase
MILFEMLTLRLPYQEVGKSWKICESVVNGIPPQFPPLEEEYLPLCQIFHRCTQFQPSERIKTTSLFKELSHLVS